MTREQKIEALIKEIYGANESEADDIRQAILAGIALRDAELLAMKFDDDACRKQFELNQFSDINGTKYSKCDYHWWAARWQFEQFIKAIKGDGDEID